MGAIRFTAGIESISAHEERVYFDGDSGQDILPCVSGLRKICGQDDRGRDISQRGK
jgi:hypothetical protein